MNDNRKCRCVKASACEAIGANPCHHLLYDYHASLEVHFCLLYATVLEYKRYTVASMYIDGLATFWENHQVS